MKKFAIIVAGGAGKRMQSELPKQFMMLKGKPVLYYTLKVFLDSYEDMNVILVLPTDYVDFGREIVDSFFESDRIQITTGGDTRFDSVKCGLQLADKESVIFVHDAVRCLVSKKLIRYCYDSAMLNGTAIPAIPLKDSIRMLRENGSKGVNRDLFRIVQTPQTFLGSILLPAMMQLDYKEKFTDEASVVEAFGIEIHLMEGEDTNIKITTPIDMVIAEKYLEKKISASMVADDFAG